MQSAVGYFPVWGRPGPRIHVAATAQCTRQFSVFVLTDNVSIQRESDLQHPGHVWHPIDSPCMKGFPRHLRKLIAARQCFAGPWGAAQQVHFCHYGWRFAGAHVEAPILGEWEPSPGSVCLEVQVLREHNSTVGYIPARASIGSHCAAEELVGVGWGGYIEHGSVCPRDTPNWLASL